MKKRLNIHSLPESERHYTTIDYLQIIEYGEVFNDIDKVVSLSKLNRAILLIKSGHIRNLISFITALNPNQLTRRVPIDGIYTLIYSQIASITLYDKFYQEYKDNPNDLELSSAYERIERLVQVFEDSISDINDVNIFNAMSNILTQFVDDITTLVDTTSSTDGVKYPVGFYYSEFTARSNDCLFGIISIIKYISRAEFKTYGEFYKLIRVCAYNALFSTDEFIMPYTGNSLNDSLTMIKMFTESLTEDFTINHNQDYYTDRLAICPTLGVDIINKRLVTALHEVLNNGQPTMLVNMYEPEMRVRHCGGETMSGRTYILNSITAHDLLGGEMSDIYKTSVKIGDILANNVELSQTHIEDMVSYQKYIASFINLCMTLVVGRLNISLLFRLCSK